MRPAVGQPGLLTPPQPGTAHGERSETEASCCYVVFEETATASDESDGQGVQENANGVMLCEWDVKETSFSMAELSDLLAAARCGVPLPPINAKI